MIPSRAAEPETAKPFAPKIAPASNEGKLALRTIRVPRDVKIDLFAAEPLLANPVAFCVDGRGRFYVAETFRLHAGVTDTRQHMYWLDDDLACRTVDDRVAMYRKHLGNKFSSYGTEHDRVRLVEDTDGDGHADRATVFADDFHNIPDGLGAGVLARGGNVWYTCIPDLWLLRDRDGDGRADERKSLHRGYGVHVGFLGHDLHGLRFGPDGKLYFSIGDRGFNVQADGRRLAVPDMGSVLRCNPDGSELEVFATGLRNPQELVFDQFGNLFTCDNNSDSGDRARCVYVVEGGDSGWRMGYQYIEQPVSRGPWNAEKLWYPQWDGQAAYLVPPLANLADGPSGLAYEPGTSRLPARYRNHFFLADFRGSSNLSGVRSFALKPKGASFEVVDQEQFAWSVLATDVDFGPDGGLYVSDWVEGWNMPGKGRIYRLASPEPRNAAALKEVQTLLAEGMTNRSLEELARLLAHADQRVRQEAQFALADRGKESIPTLARLSRSQGDLLARIHAVWGLGQVGRTVPEAMHPVTDLLRDTNPEVRAQAARVAGDRKLAAAAQGLKALLSDPSPRVRFHAAIALGKLHDREAVSPLLAMLRDHADRDPYLRHAAVMGLTGSADAAALVALAGDRSVAVRMGALLALRRQESPEVARFLDDPEPRLVVEAARAINDVPIAAALPQLAALIERSDLSEPLAKRVLNANFRLGGPDQARALAAFAARADRPDNLRTEALEMLSQWAAPSGRDRVMGLWRPLAPRPAGMAADALRPSLPSVLSAQSNSVRQAAALAAGRLELQDAAPALRALFADSNAFGSARAEALKALERLNDSDLTRLAHAAAADASAPVKAEGRRLLARLDPPAALQLFDKALDQGDKAERQSAFTILGGMAGPEADALVVRWLQKLLAGQVAPEIQLDLLEAAQKREAPEIRKLVDRYEAARPKDDPIGAYRESLAGGDRRKGFFLFFSKAEVSCLKCHTIPGRDGKLMGGQVGPDLSGVGLRLSREAILESIVAPNRQIAQGFETLVVATTDGQIHTGIFKAEHGDQLELMTPEGQSLALMKSEVEDRKRGPSAMPDDLIKSLTKSELRDLVEYLVNLKRPPSQPAQATAGGGAP